MKNLSRIIHHINSLKEQKDLVLIAVDGKGGSGKTTTALLIKHKIPKAEIITTDDFLDEKVHKIDIKELELQVLIPLSKGQQVIYSEFDGAKRSMRTVQPKGVIIIEGIYSSHSSLAKYYDLNIWVNAQDVDNRVANRDGNVSEDWERYHRPNEYQYIENDSPESRADYIIENKEDTGLNDLDQLWKKFSE